MKKLLLIALLIVGAFAEDELILLNGESIKGEYVKTEDGKIHFIPEGSLASQTIDEYRVKEVIFLKKSGELKKQKFSLNDLNNKKHSISTGLMTNKPPVDWLQYTYDFKIDTNSALYIKLGAFANFGLGISYQSNYNNDGIMIALGGGLDFERNIFGSLSCSFQYRLGKSQNFFSYGFSGYYQYYENYCQNSFSIRTDYSRCKEAKTGILPVISFERRF